MLARVLSAALVGIEAALVSVEVDVTSGLPIYTRVGWNTPTRPIPYLAVRNGFYALCGSLCDIG
jgi:hypothetical protein